MTSIPCESPARPRVRATAPAVHGAVLRVARVVVSVAARVVVRVVVRSFAVASMLVAVAPSDAAVFQQKLGPMPSLTSPVNDNVALLSDQQESDLNASLTKYRAEKGIEIVVLTLASTGAEAVDEYAARLVRGWSAAHGGSGGVVFIVVARDNRPDANRVAIAAGPRLRLTDSDVHRIVDEDIFPHFRVLDYGGGLIAGVDRVKSVLSGESLPGFVEPTASGPPSRRVPKLLVAIVVAALAACAVLAVAIRQLRSRRMVHLTGRRPLNRSFEPMLAGRFVGRRKRPGPDEDDGGNGFGGGFGRARGPIGAGDFSGGGASGTW